jgi:hypothetical protein
MKARQLQVVRWIGMAGGTALLLVGCGTEPVANPGNELAVVMRTLTIHVVDMGEELELL